MVCILTVGKKLSSSSWLSPAYSQYSARLLPAGVSLETVLHKSDAALLASVAAAAGPVVLLSEEGEQLDSEAFGELLYGGLEEGGSRLAFVIGGADGLPPELRGSGRRKISLSRMTFTHQFARVMLAEQIYRASEIRKGSNYHK
ncbi:hypothetical protein TeGR_g14065 [Tetraparma gracilis]|uniref:Ribosomal RNA large subunit methyltransferase H n=1 Tax=Tetraparma gracilis TaxID=2962635 RepID=A0ABQ6M7N3_9STRA|nr:hypothetical protein TeGR_g14065 [Tetraparma gracilis]